MSQIVPFVSTTRRGWLAGAAAMLASPALIGITKARASAEDYDALLDRYVVDRGDGLYLVNYSGMRAGGHGQLKAYLVELQSTPVSALGRADQAAFWINLYNAKTLDLILDHYPVASIKEIDLGGGFFGRGPWKAKLVEVEGAALSLDDIEHSILRRQFKDPLIHYALNCASIGCPNLQRRAWRPSTLAGQFDEGARLYINHARGLALANNRLTASKIYRWYSKDFGGSTGLRSHWLTYANPSLAELLSKDASPKKYVYDWSLNDAR